MSGDAMRKNASNTGCPASAPSLAARGGERPAGGGRVERREAEERVEHRMRRVQPLDARGRQDAAHLPLEVLPLAAHEVVDDEEAAPREAPAPPPAPPPAR